MHSGNFKPISFRLPNLVLYLSICTQISIHPYVSCGSYKKPKYIRNLNLYDSCTLIQPDLKATVKNSSTFFADFCIFLKKFQIQYRISVHQLNMIAIIQIQISLAILPGTGSMHKGGFYSESAICFLDLQISKTKYSEKLS